MLAHRMCGANCRDTGVADRGRTGRTGRGNGLNAENSLVVFVAHGIGRTIDKGWTGRLRKGAGTRHRIDRGTKWTGATIWVWKGRTSFPGLGFSNVVLGSRLGDPRRLRIGWNRPYKSTSAVPIRTLSIKRCSPRRGMAQGVSAVWANTIFTAAENAEERPSPTGSTAWGKGRLLLWVSINCRGTQVRLGLVGRRLWFLKGKNILGVELRGNVKRLKHGGPA